MTDLKVGDLIKIDFGGLADFPSVERIIGFTKGCRYIPDGWPVTETGARNPKHVTKYEGATPAGL